MEFRNYRKFEANAILRYGPSDGEQRILPTPTAAAVGAAPVVLRVAALSAKGAAELREFHDDSPVFPPPPEPGNIEGEGALAEARRAAASYSKALPQFLYQELFRVSVKPRLEMQWSAAGSLTTEVRYIGGDGEIFTQITPKSLGLDRIAQLATALRATAWSLEFEKLLENILRPDTAAQFR